MADTNSLNEYLTDIADTLRTLKGTSSPINANSFDTEMTNIINNIGTTIDTIQGEVI